MADLSPQAQAVLDAFRAVPDLRDCPSIAAALRAVVEHLSETHAGFDLADRYAYFVEVDDILAIAAELEGAE